MQRLEEVVTRDEFETCPRQCPGVERTDRLDDDRADAQLRCDLIRRVEVHTSAARVAVSV